MLLDTICSTLVLQGQRIDCRQLTLSCQFYDISQEAAIQFSLKTKRWIEQHLLHNSYSCWKFNEKHVALRSLEKLICESTTLMQMAAWEMEALIGSTIIYNQTTCRAALKKLTQSFTSTTADDFKPFWDTVFPNGKGDNISVIEGIYKVFHEENRCLKTFYNRPDIYALFYSVPSQSDCRMCEGSFAISIPVVFMEDNINYIAEELLGLLKSFGMEFCNVNGHVMLQPHHVPAGQSPYMRYFGQYYLGESFSKEQDDTPERCYQKYYLTGVEWGNLLSPAVKKRLPKGGIDLLHKSTLLAEYLDNGSMVIRSDRGIDKYDVSAAVELKQCLLPTLFPGGSYVSLRDVFRHEEPPYILKRWPRSDWAIVPVLDGEIKIVGTDLVFCSMSEIEK